MRISEAFALIAQLGMVLDAAPLSKHEDCWELRLDDRWEIAVNGHQEPKRCSHGVEVAPFECYIQYNGWPAGIVTPVGGTIAAGEAANEDAFIAALRARMPVAH